MFVCVCMFVCVNECFQGILFSLIKDMDIIILAILVSKHFTKNFN